MAATEDAKYDPEQEASIVRPFIGAAGVSLSSAMHRSLPRDRVRAACNMF